MTKEKFIRLSFAHSEHFTGKKKPKTTLNPLKKFFVTKLAPQDDISEPPKTIISILNKRRTENEQVYSKS